ncbi:MAG TPA: hypothetical protein VEF92_06490 [Burkholderiales bacterium]|nr:hypothetical protein [Burkholderiales bacterium]HYA47184.1 hypothetical protein [Burkholderiales bacterium]
MEAVNGHQSGSARVRSLAIAAAAAVGVAALIGLGASSGVLPGKRAAAPEETPPPSGLKPAVCALCGIVESIRSVEVYEESGAGGGAADLRNNAENPGAGSPEKNLRKRVVWRVTVRMTDGSYRAISLPSPPVFAVGEKVRVVEGRLVRA